VFVGYSPTQKGYRCWCPSEHHFFVSMDVSFREHEPYYGRSSDNEIIPFSPEVRQEGESNSGGILGGPILVSTSGASNHDHPSPSQGEENNNSHDRDIQNDVPSEDIESTMHEESGTNTESPLPLAPSSTFEQGENQLSTQPLHPNDLPIALRKSIRTTDIPAHLKDYVVGYKYDIANFVSYTKCNPTF
jgi:hypothetical protein